MGVGLRDGLRVGAGLEDVVCVGVRVRVRVPVDVYDAVGELDEESDVDGEGSAQGVMRI